MGFHQSKQEINLEMANVMHAVAKSIASDPNIAPDFRDLIIGLHLPQDSRPPYIEAIRTKMQEAMVGANAIAKAFRDNTRRSKRFKSLRELQKEGALSKANLDVGTLTNFANITGGQTLGYVSLDTQLARGTVRPNSFTIYQALHKSSAYQVVDYWPYAFDTGAGLPGTDFQGFGNVSSGTLATSAGKYNLQSVNLKLAVNGRSMTTALAAQNSFVDIAAQETINAALAILGSVNFACYWGLPTIFTNQFNGIYNQLPTGNIVDFQSFFNTYASQAGWSQAQALFNLIYEQAAVITSFRNFGRITHAFMSPTVAGSLQGLVTTVLNNIVTSLSRTQESLQGIVVDGDLQGMRTRFGEIQFPIDLYITARDKPAQAIVLEDGTNFATTSAPTKPQTVTVAASGSSPGSAWTSAYAIASTFYTYAVAAADGSMNESQLTFSAAVSGVAASGAYVLTITPAAAADQSAFRVFRSGLGYTAATNPAAYRYIGTVASVGSGTVQFVDNNTKLPGGETIFLLDLDEQDMALDFRYLLPLTKVELFAQNLYMPWAVCMIGAVRLKIPKFHGAIINYVPDNPVFNPLQPNSNAS